MVIQQLSDPESIPGHVVIEVKAFGINHAETHIKACPDEQFAVGKKVAALMGGMGRTINGSYAEYTRVSATNVVPIESALSWEELAAIPESYATAWTCLHRNRRA